jgi:fatty-acid desaturase
MAHKSTKRLRDLSFAHTGSMFVGHQTAEVISAPAKKEVVRDFENLIAAPVSGPVNRSWESYHFDWTKTLKLAVMHATGFYGLYLLFFTNVHPYTKFFVFVHHYMCGLLICAHRLLYRSSSLTGLGITGGYHRLFAHKSFEAPLWVQSLFAFFGAGAGEGSILWWSRDHRMHHKYGDTEKVSHLYCFYPP